MKDHCYKAGKCSSLTQSYSVEEGGESKMTKAELITMIERAGFEAVERDTVDNRVEKVATSLSNPSLI